MRHRFAAGSRRSFVQEAQTVAAWLGLELYRYNPGDGSSYRVGLPGLCYFSVSGLRFNSAREALAYLRGLQEARTLLAQRDAQQAEG